MTNRISRLLLLLLFGSCGGTLQAQWEQINPLCNSKVRCLMVNGLDIYAGTFGQGIFRSRDGGVTWEIVNTGLTSASALRVRSITVHGTDLFIGTTGEGVYRSTDGGTTWKASNSGLEHDDVIALVSIGSDLVAGTVGNLVPTETVYRSEDNGKTWYQSSDGLQGKYTSALMVVGSDIIAANEMGGVAKSSNNGRRWSTFYQNIKGEGVYTLAHLGSTLFASAFGGKLYRAIGTALPTTWTSIDSGLPVSDIAAMGTQGTQLFVGTFKSGVFRSSDSGSTWAQANEGLTNLVCRSFASNNSYMFMGTDSGMYRRPLSELGTLPVPAPGRLTAIPGNRSARLHWGASAQAGAVYQIFRSRESDTAFVRVPGITTDTAAVDSGLNNREDYYFVVRGIDTASGRESLASNEVQVIPQAGSGVEVLPDPSSEMMPLGLRPNPLSTAAILSYRLYKRGSISVHIIDPLGRAVSVPVEEQIQETGDHEIELDGANPT